MKTLLLLSVLSALSGPSVAGAEGINAVKPNHDTHHAFPWLAQEVRLYAKSQSLRLTSDIQKATQVTVKKGLDAQIATMAKPQIAPHFIANRALTDAEQQAAVNE